MANIRSRFQKIFFTFNASKFVINQTFPFNFAFRKLLKQKLNGFHLTFHLNDRKKLKTLFTIFRAATAAYQPNRTFQFLINACMVTRRPRPVRFARI